MVTLAMYPADQIRNRLRLLQLSCRHHNIWLHVIGADEPFQHWYHSKVLRLKKAIDELPESIKYILYLDGVDTFVTAPLDHIRSGFAGCRRGVIVSAESCCWPCEAPEWKNSFSEKLEHRNFPCAGIWMAERSSLMCTFAIMERVRSKLIGLQEPDSEISPFWPHRRFQNDDQFLWQCLYKSNLADVGIDSDCRFSFNVACAGARVDNRHFDFATRTVKCNGNRPGVFHFSALKGRCMDQWYGLLNS